MHRVRENLQRSHQHHRLTRRQLFKAREGPLREGVHKTNFLRVHPLPRILVGLHQGVLQDEHRGS